MRTPLGPLQQLDLQDHDLCAELLAHEKHQLIEGIVFESVFDQYVTAMERESAGTIRPIPVETAVVRLPNAGEDEYPYGAFVWAKRKTEGLGRFLKALEVCYRVWLVEWSSDDRVFTATPVSEGGRSGPTETLDVLCASVSNRDAPKHESIHDSVRNPHRIKQSVWGYLAAHYGNQLGWDVVLPRIFINWGVQPWFGGESGTSTVSCSSATDCGTWRSNTNIRCSSQASSCLESTTVNSDRSGICCAVVYARYTW